MFTRYVRRVLPIGAALVLAFTVHAQKTGDSMPGAGLPQYRLRLHNLHTGEDIDVRYRVGNSYVAAALDKLNHFLRDYRTQTVSRYDPAEFDLLHDLMDRLGQSNGVIDVVCGYRTPATNHLLRSRSAHSGVAKHSQHMLAKAIDIRVPGVSTLELRDTALSLHRGGVGYYPAHRFVHVDVGPVRQWTYEPSSAGPARHSDTQQSAGGE
jgi:uncharacterized protein YcbK (DUF882 family)